MVDWRKNLWALAFGVMISSSSYTMVIPFLPVFLLELGVTSGQVNLWSGVLFAASFFVSALMAPYWGRCADRTGRRRMVMRAGFSLAAVYLLGALVRNPVELLMVRILQGFASGFVPASMAIVASSAPKSELGSSLGFMQTALLLGGIMGPLAGGILSHLFGLRLSFVVSAVIIFAGTLLVRMLVKEPPEFQTVCENSIIEDFKLALRNHRLAKALLLLLIVQVATMILQPLLTLYVAELQGNRAGAVLASGVVYSLSGVAGAIAAPFWGRLGQRQGFLKILIIGFSGAGLFVIGQFLVTDIYGFGLLQFMFGLCIVGVYPAINTIAVSASEPEFQGRTFGLTTTANQLGAMAGPLLGGVVSSWLGIRPVFLLSGGLLVIMGLLVYLDSVQHKFSGQQAEKACR